MNKIFIKKCPRCHNDIEYKSKKSLKLSINNNTICKHCKKQDSLNNKSNYRYCPKCGKIIHYKNHKPISVIEKLNKQGKTCRSCVSATIMKGKTVYDTWVNKYGKDEADIRMEQLKDKHRKNAQGEKNPNYKNKCNGNKGLLIYSQNCKGKTFEQIHGNEKAKHIKEKLSIKSSGKNNPMYGKPAPKKSGKGWSGYYKNNYFRSLLELHYLIYLIDNNVNFESGERNKHAIKYMMDGLERNYFPDYYLVDDDTYIEIKPENLINSYQNKLKFEAAKNQLGNKYVILTEKNIVKVKLQKLYYLYINQEIIFDTGYDQKFENYYIKNRKED